MASVYKTDSRGAGSNSISSKGTANSIRSISIDDGQRSGRGKTISSHFRWPDQTSEFVVPRPVSQPMNPGKKLKKEHMKNLKKAITNAQFYLNELKTMNEKNMFFKRYPKQTPENPDKQQKKTDDKNRPRPTRPRPPPPPRPPRPPKKTEDLNEKIRQGFENLVNFILSLG